MRYTELPPSQKEISAILRWNVDHSGIIPENPKIDLENWTLTVDGKVEDPVRWTWQDFLLIPAIDSVSDFHCVEGWSVRNLKWHGVRFNTLVQIVKPKKDAKYVSFTCSDGYTTSLALKDLLKDNVILAYKLNNEFLEVPLGGPLRLIVPDKYAYKSAMWIERITFRKKKKLGFWEKRGYSDSADVWKNDRLRKWLPS
jgi:DMSO/TMAO reductase YedYZ molybdopterin-dependent catalytic subunit